MPLYEYECSSCGHRFERIVKFSDPPEKTCPKCGGEVHKLMSSPAVQFKGTGWYVTDYGSKGKDKDKDKDSKDTKSKETSDTTKDTKESKDTKPESTAKDTKSETTKDSKDSRDSKDTKGTKTDV